MVPDYPPQSHGCPPLLQAQFNSLAIRAEAAEAATRASDHQLEAAQARAAALQREFAASQSELGRMGGLAGGADAAASAAERRMRAMEAEIAKAHAHIGAIEGSLSEAQVRRVAVPFFGQMSHFNAHPFAVRSPARLSLRMI